MNEKVPYPVQPAPFSTGPSQNYQSGMPPPPPVHQQPIIVQSGMSRLTGSPQHMGKLKFFRLGFYTIRVIK